MMKPSPRQFQLALCCFFSLHICVRATSEDLSDDDADSSSELNPYPAETSACSNRLSWTQREFCRSHPTHLWLMVEGTKNALETCKKIFQDSRWNCYSVKNGPTGLTHTLKTGGREASFIDALSAAAMTLALAKACAEGTLTDCPCSGSWTEKIRPNTANYQWQGCPSEVRTPMKFVRKFLDTDLLKSRRPLARMTLHNRKVGRTAVKVVRKPACRCHGTSGSCTVKTCYKRLATLEELSLHLLKRYKNARHVYLNGSKSWVEIENTPSSVNSLTENRAVVVKQKRHERRNTPQRIKSKDLIYSSSPTNYCNYDPAQGSLGTAGRRCSLANAEYLCCGRGFEKKSEIKQERCRCLFPSGCCELVCQTCYITVQYGICKG